jgi:hypothetical protein
LRNSTMQANHAAGRESHFRRSFIESSTEVRA